MEAPLAGEVAALASSLPFGPLEIPPLDMEPFESSTSAIDARLVCPSLSSMSLTHVPPVALSDQPLDFDLSGIDRPLGALAAASIAQGISSNARLNVVLKACDARTYFPLAVSPSSSGWAVRALISPSTLAIESLITVVSLSLVGRELPCDCLPAALRVGYNHAAAPAGAVLAAAKAGDSAALKVALGSGGSTEEADEVRMRDATRSATIVGPL